MNNQDFQMDYNDARLISRVLSLYYLENYSQGEVGKFLNLSTAKVNRLLKLARNHGMVEIKLHPPFQQLFNLEYQIEKETGVQQAIVVPQMADSSESTLQWVGRAAATYLVDHLHDGDTICMSGGRALATVVQAISTKRKYKVLVVPAIGGVQGQHFTDVNNLAAELAKRLGGRSMQLHAPAFADSAKEREALCNSRHVKEVLDLARNAQIIIAGIGSLVPKTSSYFLFNSLESSEIDEILNHCHGVGEIISQIYDQQGRLCAQNYASRVVGININEYKKIPLSIGVAANTEKTAAIGAALIGKYIKTIVTDEITANEVLRFLHHNKNAGTSK